MIGRSNIIEDQHPGKTLIQDLQSHVSPEHIRVAT
jgi:hypothetical protein